MSPLLLPRYLAGSRDAILALAAHRWTPLVGVLLCLSAGLARSYDGEDLLHEPYHALRPLGAAFVGATLLFLVVHATAVLGRKPEKRGPGFRGWFAFSGLYLMTAPLAWMYAVPWERLLDPVDAAKANLWTLGIVSLWRVVLISRVVQVLWGLSAAGAFVVVMLFADAAALIVLTQFDVPVINIMGGVRLEEREALINGVKAMVLFLGLITSPIWLIAGVGTILGDRPRFAFPPLGGRPPRLALALAAASILLFTLPLPWTQPEQIARGRVDRLLAAGDAEAALRFVADRSPASFPPGWAPPRDGEYAYQWAGDSFVTPPDRAMAEGAPRSWATAIYAERLEDRLKLVLAERGQAGTWPWAYVFEQRDDGGSNVYMPIGSEHAIAARAILAHADPLPEGTETAMRRILTEAAAEPRTVDENTD